MCKSIQHRNKIIPELIECITASSHLSCFIWFQLPRQVDLAMVVKNLIVMNTSSNYGQSWLFLLQYIQQLFECLKTNLNSCTEILLWLFPKRSWFMMYQKNSFFWFYNSSAPVERSYIYPYWKNRIWVAMDIDSKSKLSITCLLTVDTRGIDSFNNAIEIHKRNIERKSGYLKNIILIVKFLSLRLTIKIKWPYTSF